MSGARSGEAIPIAEIDDEGGSTYILYNKVRQLVKTWTITEARTHIADVFDAALAQGPQRIERRDSEPVVMVAESDWKRLVSEYPSFADLVLKSPLDSPTRRPARALSDDDD